ncbi:MAG: hypothetical protein JKX81_11785 [Arenicella sp.]|nr:hypothetical protein [Arenicella sp.]
MSTLNEIVGFHYYTTRTVFECEGREVVFVNECMLGFVSIYIDGERVLRKWKVVSSFASDTSVVHDGVEYRFISGLTNWCTYAQRITMIVDGSKAQSKIDPGLSGLSGLQMTHALITPLLFGMSVGFLAGRVVF